LLYDIGLNDIIPQQYNNRKKLTTLRIRVISCEIRVVIYIIFGLFGNECFKEERSDCSERKNASRRNRSVTWGIRRQRDTDCRGVIIYRESGYISEREPGGNRVKEALRFRGRGEREGPGGYF